MPRSPQWPLSISAAIPQPIAFFTLISRAALSNDPSMAPLAAAAKGELAPSMPTVFLAAPPRYLAAPPFCWMACCTIAVQVATVCVFQTLGAAPSGAVGASFHTPGWALRALQDSHPSLPCTMHFFPLSFHFIQTKLSFPPDSLLFPLLSNYYSEKNPNLS